MEKEKVLLLGNAAVARGVYEAGVKVVSSYPGTPSTEITEEISKYDEIYSEWAPNEKVAFEVAFGAATAGARSFAAMKHVGLNVAADPLYTASYIGVNAGMVCVVADDPGMHSSQNEQDSRHHAIAAKVPMLEPSDSQECLDFTKLAYDLSEEYDTPILLRLSTRISHSMSLVTLTDREDKPLNPYVKNVGKNVMMPAMARAAHAKVEQRTKDLTLWADTKAFDLGINKEIFLDPEIGVIVAGSTYVYAREALGDKASYLKLGIVNPLPVEAIKSFAKKVKKLYVIEELDDIIQTHCTRIGVEVIGKELFGFLGEFSQSLVAEKTLGTKSEVATFSQPVPPRPPVLCPGCPHRGLFHALRTMRLFVSGDIGCYTLGAQAPLSMMDTCVCMGASVSGLHGYNLALGTQKAKKSIAVIGDSTFIHSGITGLIDITYNKGIATVIILDNSTTGMTGHQNNPTNGLNLKGEPANVVDLEALVKAIGVNRVRVIDPLDIEETKKVVAEELEAEETSVIIARRPCALLKTVKHPPALYVDNEACTGCKACIRVGCPSIMMVKTPEGKAKAYIDPTTCVGCEVCMDPCRFDAIKRIGD